MAFTLFHTDEVAHKGRPEPTSDVWSAEVIIKKNNDNQINEIVSLSNGLIYELFFMKQSDCTHSHKLCPAMQRGTESMVQKRNKGSVCGLHK